LTGESTQLPSGLALAPHLAALCVLDEQRTAAFQRGVALAIEAARARFPGETVEVVYAGTGPFAPHVPLGRVLDTSLALDPVRITIPPTDKPHWLALVTEIDIFAGVHLHPYDSGLTVPEILWPHSPARAGATVELRYVLGERPGITAAPRSGVRD
jgi:hypothetical protein